MQISLWLGFAAQLDRVDLLLHRVRHVGCSDNDHTLERRMRIGNHHIPWKINFSASKEWRTDRMDSWRARS